MATKTKTTTTGTEPATRKARTPRSKTQMEIEAEQHLRDVKTVAALLPKVAKLSPVGLAKLRELIDTYIAKPPPPAEDASFSAET